MGVGATDIIYFIATGMSDMQINSLNLEVDILRPYYSMFEAKRSVLGEKEAAATTAMTSLSSTSRCPAWTTCAGSWHADFLERRRRNSRSAEREMDPNLGAYRRSEAMMLFLLSRVEEYLSDVEAGLK